MTAASAPEAGLNGSGMPQLESAAARWRAAGRGPIAFVSSLVRDPWGGSEELWGHTAMRLREAGLPVWASVTQWDPIHARVRALQHAGVTLHQRPQRYPIAARLAHRLRAGDASLPWTEVERSLARARPGLVVLNDFYAHPPVQLLEMCVAHDWPYVTICQSNSEHPWWPDDSLRLHVSQLLSRAVCCYFVSQGNLDLAAKQLDLSNTRTELVRNTFSVPHGEPLPWPAQPSPLRIAMVGRLDPSSKGQDLLLEALAELVWRERDWQLGVFGAGPNREAIAALSKRLALDSRVTIGGHRNIMDIWAEHHVLALPSRAEGLPIAIVEAMMAGRPVVTTNVAGNAELLAEGKTGFIAEAPATALVAQALERMWAARDRLPDMGRAANRAVRAAVPPDPALVLAQSLLAALEA